MKLLEKTIFIQDGNYHGYFISPLGAIMMMLTVPFAVITGIYAFQNNYVGTFVFFVGCFALFIGGALVGRVPKK